MAAPFRSILCGIDGNAASTEAARQAITLAADGADLHFLAVNASFEIGPDSRPEALEDGLAEAARLAAEAGVEATTEMQEGRYAVDVLLPAAERHDLLVIGTKDTSRASGIVFGSTATEATHQAELPLLIARPAPEGGVASRILLTSDGSPGSWATVRTATQIATAFGARLEVVHVLDGDDPERKATVASQLAEIGEATGEPPVLEEPTGSVTQAIIDAATERRASLVVSGRRGLRGLKALGSVSERVVHSAPCSVLLVPAERGQEP